MNKRIITMIAAAFFAASLLGFGALPGAQAEMTRITVGGSGPGATAYILAGGLAELINTKIKHPKLRITAQTTRGFVANSRLVDSGQMDMGMNSTPLLYAHHRGTKPFKQKATNIRLGIPVGTSAHQWATFEKSVPMGNARHRSFGYFTGHEVGWPEGGFIWGYLFDSGIDFVNYGEGDGVYIRGAINLDMDFPGIMYNLTIKDKEKAEYVANRIQVEGFMPQFTYLLLPNNHTEETTEIFCR